MNKPVFIENAEERRKCLIELAYMREKRLEKYKDLLVTIGKIVPENFPKSEEKSMCYFKIFYLIQNYV